VAMVFVLASVGLPGLGNFVGEFLVLVGTFAQHKLIAVFAATGLVFSVPYALRIMFRTFFGPLTGTQVQDLRIREGALLAVMIAVIVWLGLFPNAVIRLAQPTVKAIEAKWKAASVGRSAATIPALVAPASVPVFSPRTPGRDAGTLPFSPRVGMEK